MTMDKRNVFFVQIARSLSEVLYKMKRAIFVCPLSAEQVPYMMVSERK